MVSDPGLTMVVNSSVVKFDVMKFDCSENFGLATKGEGPIGTARDGEGVNREETSGYDRF